MPQRSLVVVLALLIALLFSGRVHADTPRVSFLRVPDHGIQPQVVIDSASTLHLVYFSGDPRHGDLYYVHTSLTDDSGFSSPIRVNKREGAATALDAIRGAQIAVGRGGRVYVAWNGSVSAPRASTGTPMYFTRLNSAGTRFENERNIITWAGGIDGGGTLACDNQGSVYVAWHGGGEPEGGVYLAKSTDDGATFSREVQISKPGLGQCGCCAMKALVNAAGDLLILYRTAERSINRDTALLRSHDGGATFESAIVHPWYDDTCPLTGYALADGLSTTLGAWETEDQVYFTTDIVGRSAPMIAAPGKGYRKYPAVAQAANGSTLFVWVEPSEAEIGKLGWQVYDKDGIPESESGLIVGVPRYSFPQLYVSPSGGFVILY
ncbi:MAG TPA: hypothetical protein VGK19_01385 [Capsulimonadaceae bacterium]|jgi:hypothetical protein